MNEFNVFNRKDRLALSWYPIMSSNSLKKSTIKTDDSLGKTLVLFRGENGTVTAMDAYCAHLGANLKNGRVIGNNIQCPFHRWQYNQQGERITAQKNQCTKENIRTWPVREKLGLIWVWPGETEKTEITHGEVFQGGELVHFSESITVNTAIAPHLLMINLADGLHFSTVHGHSYDNSKQMIIAEPVVESESVLTLKSIGKVSLLNNSKHRGISRLWSRHVVYPLLKKAGLNTDPERFTLTFCGSTSAALTYHFIDWSFSLIQAYQPINAQNSTKMHISYIVSIKNPNWMQKTLLKTIIKRASRGLKREVEVEEFLAMENIQFKLSNPQSYDKNIIAAINHIERQDSIAFPSDW